MLRILSLTILDLVTVTILWSGYNLSSRYITSPVLRHAISLWLKKLDIYSSCKLWWWLSICLSPLVMREPVNAHRAVFLCTKWGGGVWLTEKTLLSKGEIITTTTMIDNNNNNFNNNKRAQICLCYAPHYEGAFSISARYGNEVSFIENIQNSTCRHKKNTIVLSVSQLIYRMRYQGLPNKLSEFIIFNGIFPSWLNIALVSR